jgi:hypothetical protein
MERDVLIELGIALAIAGHLAARREPLSATTRRAFRTDTRVGSRIFATATAGASGYFIAHILRPVTR